MLRLCDRHRWAGLFIALVNLSITALAFTQADWSVSNTFHFGGQGGRDYITFHSAK